MLTFYCRLHYLKSTANFQMHICTFRLSGYVVSFGSCTMTNITNHLQEFYQSVLMSKKYRINKLCGL